VNLEETDYDDLIKERDAIDYELLVRAILRKGNPEYFQSDAYDNPRSEAARRDPTFLLETTQS